MSLYLGDTVIAPNISNAANKSLSNLDSTGQGVINGKADIDLSNISSSCKAIDGQWVSSLSTLASNVNIPTTTDIEDDVSSYLPNDNYNYEVLLYANAFSTSTSGSQGRIILQSDIITNSYFLCSFRSPAANWIITAGSTSIPVGTGRKIKVMALSTNSGTFSMEAVAYRRIGTNS